MARDDDVRLGKNEDMLVHVWPFRGIAVIDAEFSLMIFEGFLS